jgi:hypothetical protein
MRYFGSANIVYLLYVPTIALNFYITHQKILKNIKGRNIFIYFLSIQLTGVRAKLSVPHIIIPDAPRAMVSPTVCTRST